MPQPETVPATPNGRIARAFVLLALTLLILSIADLLFGAARIPLRDIFLSFAHSQDSSHIQTILLRFRLPKLLTAILAGAALSVSGLLMQTTFRNPLAGPSILGISAGASLGASISLLAFGSLGILSALPLTLAASLGAMAMLLIILAAASRLRSNTTILILGIMLSAAASAIVSILQYASHEHALKNFIIWSLGSLANVSGSSLALLALAVTLGLGLAFLCVRPLNVLLLGQAHAQSLGLNLKTARGLIFTATALLTGAVTAFCGPIGFIGIAAPHIARWLLRTARHGPLLVGSLLVGANALILSDLIAQLPPRGATLPINAVASLLGLPVVIAILLKGNQPARQKAGTARHHAAPQPQRHTARPQATTPSLHQANETDNRTHAAGLQNATHYFPQDAPKSTDPKAPPTTADLELHQLAIGHAPGQPLLAPTTLSAQAGTLIALLGRNGVGKSTLLQTIAGQRKPLEGNILIQGKPVEHLAPRDYARLLAFAPPRLERPGALTVQQLVQLARFPHRGWFGALSPADHDAVHQAIALAGIPHLADRLADRLSDGERQRVALAIALAQATPIILLDEPTAFLDIPGKAELIGLLQQLTRLTSKLIVFSTHDLNTALWLADRLWIMTPEALHAALPEDAILCDTINRTFDTPSSRFDPWSMAFRPITHPSKARATYSLLPATDTLAHRLTHRALQRYGYAEASSHQPADYRITITHEHAPYAWQLADHPPCTSIAQLIATLTDRNQP